MFKLTEKLMILWQYIGPQIINLICQIIEGTSFTIKTEVFKTATIMGHQMINFSQLFLPFKGCYQFFYNFEIIDFLVSSQSFFFVFKGHDSIFNFILFLQ
jgi:hypothetical protein